MNQLLEKYKQKPVRSQIHSLDEIKQDLDDLLIEYLVKAKKYAPDAFLTNLRIAIGLIAITQSLLLLYFSYFWEFKDQKVYAVALVSSYFLLTYLETILIKIFGAYTFDGRTPAKERIRVISSLPRPDTMYVVLFYFGDKEIPGKLSLDIRNIYDGKGVLDSLYYLKVISETVEKGQVEGN
jgi:Microsomal signal peptidase 25 kDa subunit (SPC25)